MKNKYTWVIIFFVALSLLYTWFEANRPQPVDWSETFSPEDKIPYGTYIVYRSLPGLFPDSDTRMARLSVVEEFEQVEEGFSGAYIFVDATFNPDPVELDYLLRWVDKGNHLFVAAESIGDTLLNSFSLKLDRDYEQTASKLLFSGFETQEYQFTTSWGRYFILPDDFQGQQLGMRIANQLPDFIQIPHGDGQIFLNLNPWAFTNRWVLDSIGGDYYYKALSWLPDTKQTVIWDAYHTLGRLEGDTPFKVILRYPALRLALYLLLAASLCYVLFRIRREQRPIPVVRPPENRMLEFISTVSSLYFKQQEHTAVALKQIDFFLGEVRSGYHLHTDQLDELFTHMLSERAGVEEKKTEELVQLIVKIKNNHPVDEPMLKDLMKGTELFIKKFRNL